MLPMSGRLALNKEAEELLNDGYTRAVASICFGNSNYSEHALPAGKSEFQRQLQGVDVIWSCWRPLALASETKRKAKETESPLSLHRITKS